MEKHINSLLEKYRARLRAPEGVVVTAFQAAVSATIGVEIKREWVRYNPHSRTLSLTIGGPLKSELVLHKDELLARCREELGEKSAPHHLI